jgi:carboxypeptidase C (cathepsin A)
MVIQVGFSDWPDGVILDDNNVATYNLNALLAFFVKFPNLKKNDFYIAGESYAGVYIPYLAYEILKYNRLPSSKTTIIKLKGIMVGNPCTHPTECFIPGSNGTSMHQYECLYRRTYLTELEMDMLRGACFISYTS